MLNKHQDHLVALIKGISWRFFGSLVTGIVVFAISGKLDLALGVGAFEIVSKIILFYFHERLWDVIKRRWFSGATSRTPRTPGLTA